MKRIILFSVSLLIMFAACEKPEKQKGLYLCDVGYIRYEATIGDDFDSALDSLLKKIVYRPAEPYIVVPEPINVVYPTNDRSFYLIAFKDTVDRVYLQSPMDVLDTKGCWYSVIWGED